MSDQTKLKTQKTKKQEKTDEITPDEIPKPTVKLMVNDALQQLKSRKGVSLYAIKEYMTTKYNVDPAKLNFHIKKYIKSGVENGVIIQTKGTGASGSFKLVPVKEKRKKTEKEPKPNKETATKINTSKDAKTEKKNNDEKVKKIKSKEDKAKPATETTKKVEEKKVKLVKKNKLVEKIKQLATPKKGISKRKSIGSIIKKPKMKPKKLID